MLDFEDVPSRFRFDRTEDCSGRGVEDGFVEVGEELAACDFAPVMTVNYEFFDKVDTDSALDLVKQLYDWGARVAAE